MLRLLQIEFYKIRHHKLSKIFFISYFFLLSSISLIAFIKFSLGKIKINIADQGFFNFPYIWHFNTYIADYFTFFLAIIVVGMVTNEYSYRTIKQNLIDGMTKKEFILSKFLFIILLSLLSTFFVFLISLALGLKYSDYTSINIVFSELYFLLAYFIKILGFLSFILFLGFLFKKTVYALGFFIIWTAVEGILYIIFRAGLFNKQIADTIYQFFPFGSIRSVLPEPWSKLSAVKNIKKSIGADIQTFEGIPIQNFIVAIFWIALFVYLSYYLLKKRDL